MEVTTIALLLLVPAAALFVYAGYSEYRRYRADGPSSYGLTYDPETNTTHVGPLPEGDEGYDPEEFTPEPDADSAAEQDDGAATDHTETRDTEQDRQT